ncbi:MULTISPECIES: rod shape-determining protein RodA [unclassified Adlercreutzia]|uniref:rod shape-determining protein RodA n=1 Tax=unclassified Adlercreutzia TaxID=2636013 RepID=UPI0013EB289F|nr:MULTISPECIES: rod shape-determining protein RodA [unclassified Adlercreutzia]
MARLPQIDALRTPDVKRSAARPQTGLLRWVNVPFVAIVAVLVTFGLVICWSAVETDADYSFAKQLGGVAAGLILMALVWRFDYRKLANMTTAFLVVNVVLILSPHLPVIGVTTMGATSWINIGMQVQPGEFAKVTVVLFAASLVARYGGTLDDAREYLKVLGLLSIPFLCIMTQPDLGTGLVYLFISGTVLVMGGAKRKYLLITLAAGIAAVACVFAVDEVLKYQTDSGEWEYRLLKQYQRNRLLVFLDQDGANMTDEGYNLAQAKIAIGSGGLFGKGLLSGSQSTMGFLPEAPTDFIFCVLAEETGFVGAMALLALYVALILVSLSIARNCDNLFGMLVVCAIVGMWLFQILENVGMCCGLMPITGIPLPFVSYGSSFMVVNFVMLGLIGSVWSHESALGKGGNYATAR